MTGPNPRFPDVAELRAMSDSALMELRTDTDSMIESLEAAIAAAKTDPRGVDLAWENRARTKKHALITGLKHLKNVLSERGIGVPASGITALPTFQQAQALLNHHATVAFRLLRQTTEIIEACRAYIERGDDLSRARMTAALHELDACQSIPTDEAMATAARVARGEQ